MGVYFVEKSSKENFSSLMLFWLEGPHRLIMRRFLLGSKYAHKSRKLRCH